MSGPSGLAVRRRWLRVLATVLAAPAVFVAFAAWRLSRGPIDLGVLTPRLEAALDAADGSFRVDIGATRLEWDARDRDVDLRLLDVRAFGRDGGLLAAVPALAVRPSLPALVRGRLAPSAIEVLGARLRVARSIAPGVDLDVGEGARRGGADSVATRLLDGLTGRAPADGAVGWLRTLAVRDASVTVLDPAAVQLAALEALDLRLAREPGGVAVALAADAVVSDRRIPLRAAGHHHADDARTEVRLEFTGLEPRGVAPLARGHPSLGAGLARVGLAFSGSLTLDLDAALVIRNARIEVESGPGEVALADPGSADARVRAVTIVATADREADRLTVETLTADLGGPVLAIRGQVVGLDAPRTIDLDATLTGLPAGALARWWPARVAAAPRAWVTERLRDGHVRRATADVTVTRGATGFALERLAGTVHFDGLSVRWLDGMPPVTAVAGRGTFSAAKWQLEVARGKVAGLSIVGADVTLDGVGGPAPRLAVVARANGPLSAALAVLDNEPLGVARALGVTPAEAGGTVDGRVTVGVPLDPKPVFDLRATARLRNVRLPRVGLGWPLDDGDLTVTFSGNRLDVAGTARLAGAPLTIAWREDLAARTRRVDARGRVGAAERAALGFDLRPTLDGPVDADVSLAGGPRGRAILTLALDLAPAVVDLPAVAIAKPAGEPGRAGGRFTLDGDALVAVDDGHLEARGTTLRTRATRTADHRRWRTIDADATLRPRVPGTAPPHVTLTVRPLPDGNTLTVRADDAGAVLRAIDPAIEVRGGRLVYTATGDLAASGVPFEGALDVREFAVTRSPLLARLATLGSFRGIHDALANRGVLFDELGARVGHRGHTITIADGRATGPAVAVSAAGTVDRGAGTIALRGTVAPSYLGLNKAAGRLPLVGSLVTGVDGEGIQAFDFQVNGPLSKPDVRVDKLSSLAPGALRDLFRRLP